MKFVIASVDSLIIYFGQKIDADVAKDVRKAYHALSSAKLSGVTELVPSYTSIMISYDFLSYSFDEISKKIKECLEKASNNIDDTSSRSMSIPVYYGEEVGLDISTLAQSKNISIDEVIEIHSNQEYFVYAIGFFPGFPYMGEVDERIATPRLANPRTKIPKGSVGIADRQTAVYPQQSPGGWQIIGRTPLEMFDSSYDGLSYLKVGDKVKFEPISKDKFISLGGIL